MTTPRTPSVEGARQRPPLMGFRCEGPCPPPPDFDLTDPNWGAPDRNAAKRKQQRVIEWAAEHGIWPQHASDLARTTGCWHDRGVSR